MRNVIRTAILAGTALMVPVLGSASSHREAPNIARFPTVDSTDFYMFMSYEPTRVVNGSSDYVTILANYQPLQDAYGGPNYFALDPAALYEIHIDNNGDAREDITFQFRFSNALGSGGAGLSIPVGDPAIAAGQPGALTNVPVFLKNIGQVSGLSSPTTLNFNESYTVTVVRGDRRTSTNTGLLANATGGSTTFTKPYDYVGTKTFGNNQNNGAYEAYARQFIHSVTIPNCSQPARVFVGQRREGFAVNLGRVFDLVNIIPVDSTALPGVGIVQSAANNQIANKNVTTLALEVHRSCLTGTGNGVIGGWTSASLRQARVVNPTATFLTPEVNGGPLVQLSRLGMPLVNELVIGLPDKDRFSGSVPSGDGQFLTYVATPTIPTILDLLFRGPLGAASNIAPSNFPRNDLIATFLTGFPGVNQMSTVTASEMLRLNTDQSNPLFRPRLRAAQLPLGLAAGDTAGFPQGRRPGDDVVDIELRVALGALCHPVPLGANGALINLGLCAPGNAPVGTLPITDGAPLSALDFDDAFPYLRRPVQGADATTNVLQ
jgi:hypothetical protein